MNLLTERIEIISGDITRIVVDAIVNAANNSLLGGGGVDGAIHQAAGRELFEECAKLNGCKTGEAKITKGYLLPSRYVIHTVGPIWQGGDKNEPELLKNCYRNSFKLVTDYKLSSIAFPSISTGVYNFPIRQASMIALEETLNFLKINDKFEKVIFVCFGNFAYRTYQQNLTILMNNQF